MRHLVPALLLLTVLVGCGEEGGYRPAEAVEGTAPSERPQPTYEWDEDPPPVVLRLAEGDVELRPWTYCWSSGCVDGAPALADELPDAGGPGAVDFWFGVEDWTFEATFSEIGSACPRRFTVPATREGEHLFRLEPAGPAGRYQVDLFGSGEGGDASASFVWTTSTDGPVEEPSGTLALVASDDGEHTSYGLELGVSDLARQPRAASARVTVTAAGGESLSLEPVLEQDGQQCYELGSLFFADRRYDVLARQVAALGDAPYSYRVVLTLDGSEHVGTAVWPRDEIADQEPLTRLAFDPPLPGLAGRLIRR